MNTSMDTSMDTVGGSSDSSSTAAVASALFHSICYPEVADLDVSRSHRGRSSFVQERHR
jgi:hypothetical protein